MNFCVESGELSLNLTGENHQQAATEAIKVWHAAKERIHLCGLITVVELGPRGGRGEEFLFSTPAVLDELRMRFITTNGAVITMPEMRPQIVRHEEVVGSKWLALKRAHYQWPNSDKVQSWEYVTRPTRKGDVDAVVIVPFMKNPNRLVVIGEFRVPVNDYEIGFPAGLIDDGETPLEAATRELYEETRLKITHVHEVSPRLYTSAGLTDENVVMVFCEAEGEIASVQNSEERVEVYTLDLNGVAEVVAKPPCAMSARLWPFLQMMLSQGFVGWKAK